MITLKIEKGKKYALLSTVFLMILAIILLLLFCFKPKELSADLYKCYNYLVVNFCIYFILWCYIFYKKRVDILEPIVLITVIHVLLFIITPIISLYSNDILWFDQNLWGGCIKGTFFSTIGYMFFLCGYLKGKSKKNIKHIKNKVENPNVICKLAILIWLFCFFCNLVYLSSEGKNILYILTLGSNGVVDTEKMNTSVFSFLAVVSYGMISAYLYIYQFSNSKAFKIILFYLMISSFMIRGFRFIIVAVIVAPLYFDYLKKNKRPGIMSVVFLFIILAVLVGVVEGTRNGLRSGQGMGNSLTALISFDYIKDVLIENFSIYKTYYGIIQNIPLNMNYTYGQLMFIYTLVMFIPRGIWPSKPYPISQEVNAVAVSKYASKAGTAYPYLGEYYHEFGVFGICIFSFLFGRLCAMLKRYMYSQNIHHLILYSSVCPLLFQVLIRGYTPSNFYMIIFTILPILILNKYSIYASN